MPRRRERQVRHAGEHRGSRPDIPFCMDVLYHIQDGTFVRASYRLHNYIHLCGQLRTVQTAHTIVQHHNIVVPVPHSPHSSSIRILRYIRQFAKGHPQPLAQIVQAHAAHIVQAHAARTIHTLLHLHPAQRQTPILHVAMALPYTLVPLPAPILCSDTTPHRYCTSYAHPRVPPLPHHRTTSTTVRYC